MSGLKIITPKSDRAGDISMCLNIIINMRVLDSSSRPPTLIVEWCRR